MKKCRLAAFCLIFLLGMPCPGLAGTAKENVVKFYQDYLTLVSASDYVPTSRDRPEEWEGRFNAIAKSAGFEDAAAALAASDAMGADSEIAALRQAVADKILLQYKPYRE